MSTQVPLHAVGAFEGHEATHAYWSPVLAQFGVAPLHAVPQLPQLVALA